MSKMNFSFEKKAVDIYQEAAINKGLFLDSGMQGRGIPTFVAEWILERFCPSGVLSDKSKIEIINFIDEHLPRKEQKEEIKYKLAQGEQITLLDHFSVVVDLKKNERRLFIPSIDEVGAVSSTIIDNFTGLLGGGMWGAGRLSYHPPDEQSNWSAGELHIVDFKPLQVANLDLAYYCSGRYEFSFQEWRELLVSSMGSNPNFYTPDQQLRIIARLIPIVQKNVNIIELAPKGTGKSFIYQNMSRYVRVVSGGKITAAALFYNLANNTPGLLTQYDVVVFDEAQSISFNNPGEVIGVLKDYLESGRYTRGRQAATADAGLVMLANIPMDSSNKPMIPNLFQNLPTFMQETAFIDRIHGIIPGWEIPRVTRDTPSRRVGFKADYFGEVLHRLRNHGGFDEYVINNMRLKGSKDMRDQKAIQKMAAGYLRILFPNLDPSPEEFLDYCIKPSVSLRQRVRSQLSKLDPEFEQVLIQGELA
ncbi:MAG: BREX system Lon protease-like protein BrxL [Candidatus Brocadiales bacterium]|nr:BREX system Lon protease-like protein BrxL [Candidatus Brocadiales bacterium]